MRKDEIWLWAAMALTAAVLMFGGCYREEWRWNGPCVAVCERDPRAGGHLALALRSGDTCICAEEDRQWSTPLPPPAIQPWSITEARR